METRLVELSRQFEEATHVRIASTTRTIIRENIALNKEVQYLLIVHYILNNINSQYIQKTVKRWVLSGLSALLPYSIP